MLLVIPAAGDGFDSFEELCGFEALEAELFEADGVAKTLWAPDPDDETAAAPFEVPALTAKTAAVTTAAVKITAAAITLFFKRLPPRRELRKFIYLFFFAMLHFTSDYRIGAHRFGGNVLVHKRLKVLIISHAVIMALLLRGFLDRRIYIYRFFEIFQRFVHHIAVGVNG